MWPVLRLQRVRLRLPMLGSVAAAVSGIALFGLGAGITNLTGMNPLRAGLRQLAFGAVAAAVTYGIGAAVGTVVR